MTARTEYPITTYQPTYFATESFEDAKKLVKEYAKVKFMLKNYTQNFPFAANTSSLLVRNILSIKIFYKKIIIYIFIIKFFFQGMKKPIDVRYNPYTQSIEVLNSMERCQDITAEMLSQINNLSIALQRVQSAA